MSDIDFLETSGRRYISGVRSGDTFFSLPDPRDLNFQEVLAMLEMEHVLGCPRDIPDWQRGRVFDQWRASWDLPDFRSARRLAYLVDHYRAAIAYDLTVYTHQDLGELWRERRWTHLLDLIDRLPGHSQYGAAVAMDEEHAQMVYDAILSRPGSQRSDTGPGLIGWTQEVGLLASILDGVRQVQHAIVAVNSEKGKAPEAPRPIPRPKTALESAIQRAEHERRQKKHESLVARVLPQKAPVKE